MTPFDLLKEIVDCLDAGRSISDEQLEDARVLVKRRYPDPATHPKVAWLPDWNDPEVQLVYQILCDYDQPKNTEEHWEGWCARQIVAVMRPDHASLVRKIGSVAGQLSKLRDLVDSKMTKEQTPNHRVVLPPIRTTQCHVCGLDFTTSSEARLCTHSSCPGVSRLA